MKVLTILLLTGLTANAAYTEFYVQPNGGATNSGHNTSSTPTYASQSGNWNQGTGVYIATNGNLAGIVVGDWAAVYTDNATATSFIGRITAVDDGTDTITVSLIYSAGNIPTTSANARSIVVGGAWSIPNGTIDAPFNFMSKDAINTSSNPPCVNVLGSASPYRLVAGISTGGTDARYEGYTNTIHDHGMVKFDVPAGASFVMFATSGAGQFHGFEFDGDNFTSGTSSGVSFSGNGSRMVRSVSKNQRGAGFVTTGNSSFVSCASFGNLQDGFNFTTDQGATAIYCMAYNNGTDGFSTVDSSSFINCIAFSNALQGFEIGSAAIGTINVINCDAWSNNASGIGLVLDDANYLIMNCNLIGNATNGIGFIGSSVPQTMTGDVFNCAFGSGTQTNQYGSTNAQLKLTVVNPITYSENLTPWANPVTHNFRITLQPAKASGYGFFMQPTLASPTNTVGFPCIGAAQPSASGSGGNFTFFQ